MPDRVHVIVVTSGAPDRRGEFAAQRFGDLVVGRRREFAAADQFIRASTGVVPA